MNGSFEPISHDVESYHSEVVQKVPKQPKKQNNRYALLAIPVMVILGGVLYYSTQSTPSNASVKSTLQMYAVSSPTVDRKFPTASETKFTVPGELFMTATNEYGQFKGSYPFFGEFPGSQLVEPYKETTITLGGDFVKSGLYTFNWQIEGDEGIKMGTETVIKLSKAGLFDIKIHAYDLAGNYHSTLQTKLISKYVKRELRALTKEDRNKFLDAAHAIWEYTTEEGREKFGEKFTGIHTYVKEHATASEDILCDQFHEGTGFLTHHLALGNSFEASIRAVDPSVTVPYWDFTIEGQQIVDAGETPSYLMKITPVFSHDWFGEVDHDNHIKNSRWAHTPMPSIGRDDVDVTPHNSYGYFRSYWNNNNDPEIVRHMFDVCGLEDVQKKVPSCSTHYGIMNTVDLAGFQTMSPGDGHGPMHVQMGGVFGDCVDAYKKLNNKWSTYLDTDVTDDEITAGGYEVSAFKNKWGETGQRRQMFNTAIMGEYFHIYRGLWRSHMCAVDASSAVLKCPDSCDTSVAFEDCACEVKGIKEGTMDWKNIYPCMLNDDNQAYFSTVFNEEFLKDLTDFVTIGNIKEGEMLHSGSPSDIMFWMIHPVIERLLAAKRVSTVNTMGGVEFVKWENVDATSDNWYEYSYYNLEAGENAFHPEAYTCVGHAADDVALPVRLPYTDAILGGGADKNGDGMISNWEFFLSLDPNNVNANDYVFDNFEWSHCDGKIIY